MDWRLGTRYDPEQIALIRLEGADTSYFARPQTEHDPRFIVEGRLNPAVSTWILETLNDAFRNEEGLPLGAEDWLEVYVAGSSLTRLWRDHGDLDVLLGIHWPEFFKANPSWRQRGRADVATAINARLHDTIWRDDWYGPDTGWASPADVTFYVNHQHTDIREMRPYAAWDVRRAIWAVPPIELPEDWDPDVSNPQWATTAGREIKQAERLIEQARRGTPGAASSAVELWDRIHDERSKAFERLGGGFNDYQTYRWQAHKRAGTSQALRALKKAVV